MAENKRVENCTGCDYSNLLWDLRHKRELAATILTAKAT